jgi:hypothetical protein
MARIGGVMRDRRPVRQAQAEADAEANFWGGDRPPCRCGHSDAHIEGIKFDRCAAKGCKCTQYQRVALAQEDSMKVDISVYYRGRVVAQVRGECLEKTEAVMRLRLTEEYAEFAQGAELPFEPVGRGRWLQSGSGMTVSVKEAR